MASQQDRGAASPPSTYWTSRPPSVEMHLPSSRWGPALHQYPCGNQSPQSGAPLRPSSRPSLPSLGSTVAPPPGFQHTHAHSYTAYQHLGPFGDTRRTMQSSSAPSMAFGGAAAGAGLGGTASASIVRDQHAGSSAPLLRYGTPSAIPHQPFQMAHPLQSTPRPPAPNGSAGAPQIGGQPLREADVTPIMWDDEGVLCYTVVVGDNVIGRRFDNDWVNCTKAMNIVGLSRGKRDGLLKHEEQRLVVRRGSKQLKGVWLPLQRARALAASQGISSSLYPILEDDIEPFLYLPNNRYRTQQLVETFAALRSSRDVQAMELSNETDEEHAERTRKMDVLNTMVADVERKLEQARPAPRLTKPSSSEAQGKKKASKTVNLPGLAPPREQDKQPLGLASAPSSQPAVSSSQGAYFHPPSPRRIQYGWNGPSVSPTQTPGQAQAPFAAPTPYRPHLAPLAPVDLAPNGGEEVEPFVFYNNVTPQALESFSFGLTRASIASEMSIAEGEGVASNDAPLGFDPQVFSKVPLPARRHSFPQVEYTPRFTFPFDQHQLDEEARQPSPQSLERSSRMSIDSAASFLFPGVGLGPTSLVAPSTVLYAPDPSFAHPPQPYPPPPHTLDPRQAFSPPYPSPISSSTFSFPSHTLNCDWNAGDQPVQPVRPPPRPQHPQHLLRRSTYSPEHDQIDEGVVFESPTLQYNVWSLGPTPPPASVDQSCSFPAFPTSLSSAQKAVGEQGATGAGIEMMRASSTAGITLVGPRARNDSIGAVVGDLVSKEDGIAEQGMGETGARAEGKGGVKRGFEWDATAGEPKRPKLSGRRASVAW